MSGIASELGMRLAIKPYASNVITPGSQPASTVDPGQTGGQVLRRVKSSLVFQKSFFVSKESRPDRQTADGRSGAHSVPGTISGELSCLTYESLFAASLRGTFAAGNTKGNVALGTIAATSTQLTCSTSDWVTQGFNIGDTINVSGSSTATDGQNLTIIAFTNSKGHATTSPAPAATFSSASGIVISVPGKNVVAPTNPSNIVIPKFAIEHYYQDIAVSHLFKETRVQGFKLAVPAEGIATIDFNVMGRDAENWDATSPLGVAPFFTGPSASTTTTALETFGGQIIVNGVSQGIITATDLTADIKGEMPKVNFYPLAPEIFTKTLDVKGTITALLFDDSHINLFDNETEFSLLMQFTDANSGYANFVSFFMPRVKYTGAAPANQGEGSVPVSLPFQALLQQVNTNGLPNTTISIQDSLAT